MRVVNLGLLTLVLASGCWSPLGEVLATHISAGGIVRATLDGGPMHACNGLVSTTVEPLSLSAQGTDMSLGFQAVTATDGLSARTHLLTANQSVTLTLDTGFDSGGSKLQLYADQKGCIASSGTMTLRTDGNDNLEGEISAAGTLTGSQDTCTIEITMMGIPIDNID